MASCGRGAVVLGDGEALPAACGWTLTQVLPPDANVDEMGRVKVSSAQAQPCRLSVHMMAARGQAVGEQMQAKSAHPMAGAWEVPVAVCWLNPPPSILTAFPHGGHQESKACSGLCFAALSSHLLSTPTGCQKLSN